jgi:hypothetical protein
MSVIDSVIDPKTSNKKLVFGVIQTTLVLRRWMKMNRFDEITNKLRRKMKYYDYVDSMNNETDLDRLIKARGE